METPYVEESGQLAESIDWWDLQYTSISDQLICPICRTALVDPYTTDCGHVFCFECLNTIKESSSYPNFVCPVDRTELQSAPQPAPFLIKSLLDELVVSCPYSERGCNFVGKRWLLNSHVSFECQFALVYCYPPCSKLVERRHFNKDGGVCLCEDHLKAEIDDQTTEVDKNKDETDISTDQDSSNDTAPNDDSNGGEFSAIEVDGSLQTDEDESVSTDEIEVSSAKEDSLQEYIDSCISSKISEALAAQNTRIESLECENRTLKRQLDVCQRMTMRGAADLDSQMLMEYDRVVQELQETSSALTVQQQSVANLIALNTRSNTEMQYLKGTVDSIRRQMFLLNQSHRRLSMSSQLQLAGLSGIDDDADGASEDSARRRSRQKL